MENDNILTRVQEITGVQERARAQGGVRDLAVVVTGKPTDRTAIDRASLLRLGREAHVVTAHAVEQTWPDGRRGLALRAAPGERQGEDPGALRPELAIVPYGPRDLRTRLFGSAAEGVVRAADYPVLVTRLPAQMPYERMLIATDFSPVAAEALRFALDILPPHAADPWVVHAYDTSYALVLRQVNAPAARILEYHAKAREEAEARMEEFLAPFRVEGRKLRPICRSGEPVDTLRRCQRALRAEVLVVGKHAASGAGRPMLGTVAERSLRAAPCDVLVVPGRQPTLH